MKNIMSTSVRTILIILAIFSFGYFVGGILTPIAAILVGIFTSQKELAIGSSMAFVLAAISPLGMIFYLIPGFISTLWASL